MIAVLATALAPPAAAGPVGWAHQATSFQGNGAVTVKSLSGASYVATQNPAGAVAKANQNAVTQPPTVIVQATASIPIKVVGTPCTPSTTGTPPSETADEGTAILADRSSLLTCQSGMWAKTQAENIVTALYLRTVEGDPQPAMCPSSWTQIDYRRQWGGNGANNTRTCLPPAGKSCSVMYLGSIEADTAPNSCPIGWSQADYRRQWAGGGANNTRSCYKC